jgi:hypothetical protein
MTFAPRVACNRPSSWVFVASDIRKALARRGHPDHHIEELLVNLRPIFEAVERARTHVEDEVVWALVAVAADRARRRANVEHVR